MNYRLHSWLEKKKVSVSKYWRFQLVLRSLNRWSVNGESRTPYSEIKVPQISRETSGVPFMLSLLQCESFGKPEQGSCGIIPSSSAMVFRSAKRRERIPKIIFLENCLVLNPSPRCTLRHHCSGVWVSSSFRAQGKKPLWLESPCWGSFPVWPPRSHCDSHIYTTWAGTEAPWQLHPSHSHSDQDSSSVQPQGSHNKVSHVQILKIV